MGEHCIASGLVDLFFLGVYLFLFILLWRILGSFGLGKVPSVSGFLFAPYLYIPLFGDLFVFRQVHFAFGFRHRFLR